MADPVIDLKDPRLDLIKQYESLNQNIRNWKYSETSKPKRTAQGYYQITNENWGKVAPKMGIDTGKFPNAMAASESDQRKVAAYLLAQPDGITNWTTTNKRLEAALQQQEQLHSGKPLNIRLSGDVTGIQDQVVAPNLRPPQQTPVQQAQSPVQQAPAPQGKPSAFDVPKPSAFDTPKPSAFGPVGQPPDKQPSDQPAQTPDLSGPIDPNKPFNINIDPSKIQIPQGGADVKPTDRATLLKEIRDNPDQYPDLYKQYFPEQSAAEKWWVDPEHHPSWVPGSDIIRKVPRGMLRMQGINPYGAPEVTSPRYAGMADIEEAGMGALEGVGAAGAVTAAIAQPELIPVLLAGAAGASGGGYLLGKGADALAQTYGADADQRRFWSDTGELVGGMGGGLGAMKGWRGTGRYLQGGGTGPVQGLFKNPYVRAGAASVGGSMLGHPYIGGMLALEQLRKGGVLGAKSPKAPVGPPPPGSATMTPDQMTKVHINLNPQQRAVYRQNIIDSLTKQGYSQVDATAVADQADNQAAQADADRANQQAKATKATAPAPGAKPLRTTPKQLNDFLKNAHADQRAALKGQYMQILIDQGMSPGEAELHYNSGVVDALEHDIERAKTNAPKAEQGPTAAELQKLKDMMASGELDSNIFSQSMSKWMSPEEIKFHVNEALTKRFGAGPQAQITPQRVPAEGLRVAPPPRPTPNPMGGFNQPLGTGGAPPNAPVGEPYVGPRNIPLRPEPVVPQREIPQRAAPEPPATLVDKWTDAMVERGIDPSKLNMKDPQVVRRLRHDLFQGEGPIPDQDALKDAANRAGVIQRQAELHPDQPRLRSRQLEITPPERGPGGRITKQGKMNIKREPIGPVAPPPQPPF